MRPLVRRLRSSDVASGRSALTRFSSIVLIGAGNVGFFDKPFPSAPDSLGDGFANASKNLNHVSEDQYMKEPKPASNDLAFAKSFLSSILALLCNVFDTRGSAVMVLVELTQSSEISSVT